jgi:hypothetical protein
MAYVCTLCGEPEKKCKCLRFCTLCKSDHGVRLCQDGCYYCADCREICEYTADEQWENE